MSSGVAARAAGTAMKVASHAGIRAFTGRETTARRRIRRRIEKDPQKKRPPWAGGLPIDSTEMYASELEGRTQVEGAADLGLEQRVFAHAVDEQRVAFVGQVLHFEDQREVVVDVPGRRAVDEQVRLVALQVAARRCR